MLPDHFLAILNEFPAFTYSSAASSTLDAPLKNVEHDSLRISNLHHSRKPTVSISVM